MSLRTRLLASHLLIVAVFLCIISLVLLLLVTDIQRAIVLQRLDATADASLALALRSLQLADLPLERVAQVRNVRVLLTDVQGQVLSLFSTPAGIQLQAAKLDVYGEMRQTQRDSERSADEFLTSRSIRTAR